jgi:hypothetical protein
MTSLAIEWHYTRHPNSADTSHSLARNEHMPTNFLYKKLIIQCKNTEMSSISLEITKKAYVKEQKCP